MCMIWPCYSFVDDLLINELMCNKKRGISLFYLSWLSVYLNALVYNAEYNACLLNAIRCFI